MGLPACLQGFYKKGEFSVFEKGPGFRVWGLRFRVYQVKMEKTFFGCLGRFRAGFRV
jgi:hypothetical protein